MANKLSAQLGQPIVIENRPGAAAIVGAEAAARSAPDGYTLFMADNGTFVYHLGIYKKLPYDPNRDFIPVGMIVRGYMLLLTGPNGPKSVKELVDVGEQTARETQQRVQRQRHRAPPRDGAAQAARGHRHREHPVQGHGRGNAGNDERARRGRLRRHLGRPRRDQGGKVRPLAVASKKRLAALPDVPTFEEAGFPDFEVFFWQGIAVPAGTPRDIVSRLSTELVKALQDAGSKQAAYRRRHGSAAHGLRRDGEAHPQRPSLLGAAHQEPGDQRRLT